MIRPADSIADVYLYKDFVDMRKQANGLSVLVEQELNKNPFAGGVYVFCNRARTIIKIITWEKNGFVVWSKRLEKEKFPWPKKSAHQSISMNGEELNWILNGVNLWAIKPHETLNFSGIS